MLRNIAAALTIFALITGIAVWVARVPDKAAMPATPDLARPPDVIMLEPDGDFAPHTTAPVFKIRAPALQSVYARFYRLRDRALMLRLYRGISQGSLSPIAVARLLTESTAPEATAWLTLKNGVQEVLWPGLATGGTMPSGFYLVTVAADTETDAQAASWFIRSDLHVIALNDNDGWHVLCQDLHARPITATLTWFGFDTAPLLADEPCSAADQVPPAAKIPADAPLQLLLGEDSSGNLAFVPLRGAPRPPADPAAGDFLTTERAHYLPGQTIMALAHGPILTGDKTVLSLMQPNGLRVQEKTVSGATAQLAWIDFPLPVEAAPGTWRLRAQKDGVTLRDIPVLVGEEPAALRTGLRLTERRDRNVTLTARITDINDTPLPNRAATLQISWISARHLPEISPDYAFGSYDAPEQQPQTAASWISGASTTLNVHLPPPPLAPYPVQAQLRLEPWPAAKIAAAQTTNVVFPTRPWALGIRANFGDAPVPDGSEAGFKIALFKTAATTAAPPELRYELVAERRSFRWFFANGAWKYHTDVAAATIAQDAVKLDDGHKGQIGITLPRGQYRLDVVTTDRSLISSWRFQVGVPVPEAAAPTGLSLRQRTADDGKPQITTRGRGLMTMIAADTKLRAVKTDTGSAERDIAFTLDAPAATGLNILTLAADTETRGLGETWLPPQNLPDALGQATLHVPADLTAGAPAKIGVQFAAGKGRPAFAQIIAQPVEEHRDVPLLTAALHTPQPRRFTWTSNILPPQPATSLLETTQPPFPLASGSSRSAAVPIGTDGSVALTLSMPDHTGSVALHLLVWTENEVHAQIQNVTLAAGKSALRRQSESLPPIFTAPRGWACAEPLTAKHSTVRLPSSSGKHAASTPIFAALSPVALPDLPEALTELLNPRYVHTETAAHALRALQDFSGIMIARGISSSVVQERRDALWNQIWQRQQGDGGIAGVPDTTVSDLSATALVLHAWNQAAPTLADPARLEAMQKFLQRRLDNPWNAENELAGRADGFYALSLFGQTDAAALRYFVEKFGNQLRDAVREAKLAAALRHIQDHEKSQAFIARAQAQLTSLRHDDPGRAWQVLAIMAQHNLVPAAELAAQAHQLPQTAPLPWFAAISLHARAAIAAALPVWETERPGGQVMQERGVQGLFMPDKPGTQVRYKSGPPLYVCTDHAGTSPSIGASSRSGAKAPVTLTRTFYTPDGTRIAATSLRRGARYILVISGKNWRTGSGEIDVPLPQGLTYQTIIPSAANAGTLKWLVRTDSVTAATRHDRGVILAIARTQSGDGRVAILVEAHAQTQTAWSPVTLTQSQGAAASSNSRLIIH